MRIAIDITDDLHACLARTARAQHVSMTDVVRRGIAVIKVVERERKKGPCHFGFVKDPSQLDLELVGLT